MSSPHSLPIATRIVPYRPQYQPDFYRINAAWICESFSLEEEDKRMLNNPEAEIIARGGQAFFLTEGEKVAATCGVLKLDPATYELVRMSVDRPFRGKGYGEIIVRHAIAWAKEQGARNIILETGSGNTTALALYERLGFKHYLPDPAHRSGLARADVFMRL